MNDEIKTLFKKRNWLYQRQKISDNLDYNMQNAIATDMFDVVNSSKFKYQKHVAKELNILEKWQLKPKNFCKRF